MGFFKGIAKLIINLCKLIAFSAVCTLMVVICILAVLWSLIKREDMKEMSMHVFNRWLHALNDLAMKKLKPNWTEPNQKQRNKIWWSGNKKR